MEVPLGSKSDKRPKDFYRTDYDVSHWDDIKVPMNWNLAGLQKDGNNKYGDPLYSNQRVIFQHSWQPMNDWKRWSDAYTSYQLDDLSQPQ